MIISVLKNSNTAKWIFSLVAWHQRKKKKKKKTLEQTWNTIKIGTKNFQCFFIFFPYIGRLGEFFETETESSCEALMYKRSNTQIFFIILVVGWTRVRAGFGFGSRSLVLFFSQEGQGLTFNCRSQSPVQFLYLFKIFYLFLKKNKINFKYIFNKIWAQDLNFN